MSVSLIERNTRDVAIVQTNTEFLNVSIFKRLASSVLKCAPHQIQLFNGDIEYGDNDVIKRGQSIEYFVRSQPKVKEQKIKKGIISPEELQLLVQASKIVFIKSANQQNIEKAKENSIWATTYSNQQRLKYYFNNYPHILLLFAANKSHEIKGIARMQSQPDSVPDKSVWVGVGNIRLGGNFKIKWIRKEPLSLSIVDKHLGSSFKDSILKSSDGQQFGTQDCRRLARIYPTPSQPYYSPLIDQPGIVQEKQSSFPPNHSLSNMPFNALLNSFDIMKLPQDSKNVGPITTVPSIQNFKLRL